MCACISRPWPLRLEKIEALVSQEISFYAVRLTLAIFDFYEPARLEPLLRFSPAPFYPVARRQNLRPIWRQMMKRPQFQFIDGQCRNSGAPSGLCLGIKAFEVLFTHSPGIKTELIIPIFERSVVWD